MSSQELDYKEKSHKLHWALYVDFAGLSTLYYNKVKDRINTIEYYKRPLEAKEKEPLQEIVNLMDKHSDLVKKEAELRSEVNDLFSNPTAENYRKAQMSLEEFMTEYYPIMQQLSVKTREANSKPAVNNSFNDFVQEFNKLKEFLPPTSALKNVEVPTVSIASEIPSPAPIANLLEPKSKTLVSSSQPFTPSTSTSSFTTAYNQSNFESSPLTYNTLNKIVLELISENTTHKTRNKKLNTLKTNPKDKHTTQQDEQFKRTTKLLEIKDLITNKRKSPTELWQETRNFIKNCLSNIAINNDVIFLNVLIKANKELQSKQLNQQNEVINFTVIDNIKNVPTLVSKDIRDIKVLLYNKSFVELNNKLNDLHNYLNNKIHSKDESVIKYYRENPNKLEALESLQSLLPSHLDEKAMELSKLLFNLQEKNNKYLEQLDRKVIKNRSTYSLQADSSSKLAHATLRGIELEDLINKLHQRNSDGKLTHTLDDLKTDFKEFIERHKKYEEHDREAVLGWIKKGDVGKMLDQAENAYQTKVLDQKKSRFRH